MDEIEFQFFDLLKKHDFWYEKTCDHFVWTKGSQERREIGQWLKEHPQLNWIWVKFAKAKSELHEPTSLEELRRD